METARNSRQFNWQQKGWPAATVDRRQLRGELAAFKKAFLQVRDSLAKPLPQTLEMAALVDEAVKTSAIEGVKVDESVVMSSICKALGLKDAPLGFSKDVRSEGVAQMVLSVRSDWNKPISANLLRAWHGALLANDPRGLTIGDFRSHEAPMRVISRDAYGEVEVLFEAPPSRRVPKEIARFVETWRRPRRRPEEVALRCAMLHLHFESIHPFEDGNGRVGRALVAKVLAEGLGAPLVLPVSLVIARHRKAYYEAIHGASMSLDWTPWAKFIIPVLTETLHDFLVAAQFVAAKGAYLKAYEAKMSERAKSVILRMFRDGPAGVASGLSVAKWRRMTKVSKPTATRDLAELAATGAIIAEGAGVASRYRLALRDSGWLNEPLFEAINEAINEPQNDPLNDPINRRVFEIVGRTPGVGRKQLIRELGKSKATVERALAALVRAGKVEHRGSKKTGGYYALSASAAEGGAG